MKTLSELIQKAQSAEDKGEPVVCGKHFTEWLALLRHYLPEVDLQPEFDGRQYSFRFCGAKWINASSAE